ncbi:glycosyltransferase family A protein [Kosakonia sacchari]|uniref:Glycosyltransferase family A protein n=1 Tax=Kosakonia sacchari TaxID=1158459 RepID=A0ABZ0MU12_9ENTR|nr:glycosyltransferase family A protein [Kosakonia sacchari]WOZ79000.1 glycosyltransferase family A protein [Kosakonia sacchari]
MLHILVPSKNNSDTLLKQVKVFNEVFNDTSDIKVIVLDNSQEENYQVKELCHKNNWIYDISYAQLSVADNFNRGIDFIRDKDGYSVFIGDDDFVTKEALEICNHLEKNNISVFRPIFKNFVYWKGFSSRRGEVRCDFEVRKNNFLLQNAHKIIKKYIFNDINKCDGPQFNLIPSFYHCIFSNKIAKTFSFGPFAPDSYSAGFLQRQNSSYMIKVSDAILPGSAPKSSSAYTAIKDGFDTFQSHAHTSAFLKCECLPELGGISYLSDNIWYLSFCAGFNEYRSAAEFTMQDINALSNYKISKLLKIYKKGFSLASALTIKKNKYGVTDFISYLKKGYKE